MMEKLIFWIIWRKLKKSKIIEQGELKIQRKKIQNWKEIALQNMKDWLNKKEKKLLKKKKEKNGKIKFQKKLKNSLLKKINDL